MKKEVEILLPVYDDPEIVLSKLDIARPTGSEIIVDYYYFDPLRVDLQPGNNGRLEKCFRIRKYSNKNKITYKKDYFDENDVWQYSDEYECTTSDHDIFNIVKMLGLEILVELRSKKHFYQYRDCEIVFEQVESLGNFIEIEYCSDTDIPVFKIKKEMIRLLKLLNLNVGEELNAGKPELFLKQNN